MNLELLNLNFYGQFVWPAFIFTFLSCFFLYLKTMKEFKKQQKIYLKEFAQLESLKIGLAQKKKNTEKVWVPASI